MVFHLETPKRLNTEGQHADTSDHSERALGRFAAGRPLRVGAFVPQGDAQTIGVSGVGLNGLLTNVLSLLSLTEMGVGSVIIYHMYAPLANGDWEKICRLMQFYRNVYRRIALAMTGAGLLLVPFLPYLVNGVHYSHSYVTAVFLLFLAQTVSSYLFSYKRSLLSADQKQYVITIVWRSGLSDRFRDWRHCRAASNP